MHMLPEELLDLVRDIRTKQCEMNHIEVKKAKSGAPHRLYDTLSSFANQTGGGIIVFGMEEKDRFAVCGVYDPQDLQVKVTEQANQMSPVVRPLFTVATMEDKVIISAEISECDTNEKPCFYKGAGKMRGSYIRVGDADMPMTEYEIYSYEAFKRKIQDEIRPIPAGIGATLNTADLNLYFAEIRKEKPNLAALTDGQILQLGGFAVDGQPTMASLMLFGLYPQANFPQLCITAVVVPGYEMGDIGDEDARFLDNKKIEGIIPQMLDGAMSFVQRNMRVKTILNDSGKREDKAEYPMKAVREIILNALIHRDYCMHTENSPIRIMLFADRLEVENPGGLYGRLTLDNLGKVGADTRNPYIASALEIMIDTENRFSGIPTIRHETQKANLPAPVFTSSRGVFKVILHNGIRHEVPDQNMDAMDLEDRIIALCRTPKSREEIAGELGFSAISYMMSKYVNPLLVADKLEMILPDRPKSKNQRYFAR
jgi:ATP-dependent DNA helicase RecG